jgi:hypothetical protein
MLVAEMFEMWSDGGYIGRYNWQDLLMDLVLKIRLKGDTKLFDSATKRFH